MVRTRVSVAAAVVCGVAALAQASGRASEPVERAPIELAVPADAEALLAQWAERSAGAPDLSSEYAAALEPMAAGDEYDVQLDLMSAGWLTPADALWPTLVAYHNRHAERFARLRELAAHPRHGSAVLGDGEAMAEMLRELAAAEGVDTSDRPPMLAIDLPFELFVPGGQLREAYRIVQMELMLMVGRGDSDGAAGALAAAIGLAQRSSSQPAMLGHLTHLALVNASLGRVPETISHGPGLLDDGQLAALSARVAALDPIGAMERAIADEHAVVSLDMVAARRWVAERTRAERSLRGAAALSLMAMNSTDDLIALHENLSRQVIERVRRGRLEPWRVEPARLWRVPDVGVQMVMQMESMAPRFVELALVAEARRRATLVGLAAERYRLRTGAQPTSQAELVDAGLLAQPLRSVFSDGVLRIAAIDDGVRVYDVGPDGVDGGGLERCDRAALSEWARGEGDMPAGDVVRWTTLRSDHVNDEVD